MTHLLSMVISDDLRDAQYLMNKELVDLLKSSSNICVKFKDDQFEITIKAHKKEANEDPERNLDYMEGGVH